jgi:predicted GNAT family N-acyltransferase
MKVVKVSDQELLKKAFELRIEVFVVEQKVPLEEEIDEFEDESYHFVAIDNNSEIMGACRWRETEKGAKLERFVVSKNARHRGVASALIQSVIDDIDATPEMKGKTKYLFAQKDVMPLYAKFGFKPYGDTFDECGIVHQAMKK